MLMWLNVAVSSSPASSHAAAKVSSSNGALVYPVDRRGIILREDTPEDCVSHFGKYTSWTYNYAHRIQTPDQLNFINQFGIEYVPMVDGFKVESQNEIGGNVWHCYLTEMSVNKDDKAAGANPLCNGASELSTQLGRAIGSLKVRPRFLMGMNEPWRKPPGMPSWAPYTNITDYVTAWVYIQKAAEAHNLQLISPTLRKGSDEGREAWWMANFIAECDKRPGCDPERIWAFSLHNYECKAGSWEDEKYGFLTKMRKDLTGQLIATETRSREDWQKFVYSRPVWVTEMSCNNEQGKPDNAGSCRRNTGQHDDEWGDGAIAAVERHPDVMRWAWWGTYRKEQDMFKKEEGMAARLCYGDGSLSPMGRAWIQPNSNTLCCHHADECKAMEKKRQRKEKKRKQKQGLLAADTD